MDVSVNPRMWARSLNVESKGIKYDHRTTNVYLMKSVVNNRREMLHVKLTRLLCSLVNLPGALMDLAASDVT